MPKVALSDVKPGQIVSRPVTNPNGMLLVKPGTELTDTLIERLKHVGIETLYVRSDGAQEARQALEAALRALDERFSGHEQDALMMELKRIVAEQLAQED